MGSALRPAALLGALLAVLAACATAPEITIAERLVMLGLPETSAVCVAGRLEATLTEKELTQFARFTEGLSETDRPTDLLIALRHVNDFRIAGAVFAAGAECLYRPNA